jgi:hypothetical protein
MRCLWAAFHLGGRGESERSGALQHADEHLVNARHGQSERRECRLGVFALAVVGNEVYVGGLSSRRAG